MPAVNRPADAARAAPDAPAWVGLRRLLRDIGEETRAVLLRLSPGASVTELVLRRATAPDPNSP